MINNNPEIKLKYYRELMGISQKALAERTQTSQGYISEIEKNIKSPTIRMLYHISEALEVCPCMLLPCIIEYIDKNKCDCGEITNDSSNI